METSLNSHFSLQPSESKTTRFPDWYSPETGIYSSKHSSVSLPTDCFLDIVSFIFSHQHDGVTALIDSSSGYSISYSKLLPLIQSMASGLHHLGVSQGDVVLLLLPNSVYFPIIFLSVLYLGAIVTAMNPLASMLEIKKQIADSGVRFAFTLLDKVDKLKNLGVHAIGVPENLNLDSEKTDFLLFHKLIEGQFDKAPRPVIRQQDTAAIMNSSGTTGVSKGVVLTHGNFIAMIELFVRFEASQYEYSSSKNVYLAVLPMFHIYGLSLFAVGLLSLGTSIVVMRRFNATEMVNVIDKYGVTHFPVVPPILTTLTMRAKGVRENSFKSLKQVSCGAASLTRKAIEDFVQAVPHVDFIQGYGMTESTAVGNRGFNNEKHHKYSSVGLLAPNMQAKVVDWNSGSSLPPGSYGELWLRGPGIMQGYLNNVEATRMTIDKDGWLRTGDIVCFDEDGYMYVSDRLKEIIKYKGYQIAPADLEAILISHPEILDSAVIPAIDEVAGEIPVAFVVRRQGSTLTQGAVMDFVAKQVAPYKKVRKVVFTKSIPKSAAGKTLRRELRNFLSSRL
ncbi:4-coumarate--CoA ligase-like 6 isoform X1 [Herrania umbratica]|uniref:4-coumarate--CoA ligase n=1 Tax=Herrania umbratica TaxID=108875 RepID=A0A6J0ZFW2_9ROSI|nr:4-coumarate--CoA ligase-like 6 isoform X1 [Herrania umbratica]